MRNRKRLLLLLIPASVLAVVLSSGRPENQPTWQGRTLEQWLDMRQNRDERSADAIKAIGTNAIPYLLKSISYEAPALWTRHFGNSGKIEGQLLSAFPKLEGWLCSPIDRKERKAEMALDAFLLLQESANSAAPMLRKLDEDAKRDGTRNWRALYALWAVDPEELPAFLKVGRCGLERQTWTNNPAR